MAKMKTPTLEEVREYFKDAKKIMMNVTGKKYKINTEKLGVYLDGEYYRQNNDENNSQLLLWDPIQGYAKILSYKEPKEKTYKITREQIFELCMPSLKTNRERFENLFPSVFKTELVAGKWYINNNGSLFFALCIEEEYISGHGFVDGVWRGKLKRYFSRAGLREATHQEVTEALKKEIVRRGLVIGAYASFGTTKEVRRITDEIIWNERHKCLSSGKNVLMCSKGVWAESIATITKSEAEEKLKEIGVNAKIV